MPYNYAGYRKTKNEAEYFNSKQRFLFPEMTPLFIQDKAAILPIR